MKYSKSDSAYFRKSKKENSIKGGKLKENGILENSDFFGKNGNNVVPKQKFKFGKNNNTEIKLQIMMPNSQNPIKIMKQKITDEPYIFFGYNPVTETYHLVCYNNKFSSINPIKCKKLVIHKNGSSEIVKLSHTEFLNIGIEELIVLCYHFLKIRQKNHGFMNTLYQYLSDFIFKKVLGTRFSNSNNHRMYKDMVEEIGGMIMDESSRMLNKRGGKLDIDGKLDSRDFMKNNIESKQEIVRKNNNNTGIQEIVRRNNTPATNITVQQNFQNQTVLPKEIIKKGFFSTGEPYIFFGYDPNPKKRKYRFVCYNRDPFSEKPVFRRLEDNDDISRELTLNDIKKIDNKLLTELFCFLNNKTLERGNGVRYMERLQVYLLNNFSKCINTSCSNT